MSQMSKPFALGNMFPSESNPSVAVHFKWYSGPVTRRFRIDFPTQPPTDKWNLLQERLKYYGNRTGDETSENIWWIDCEGTYVVLDDNDALEEAIEHCNGDLKIISNPRQDIFGRERHLRHPRRHSRGRSRSHSRSRSRSRSRGRIHRSRSDSCSDSDHHIPFDFRFSPPVGSVRCHGPWHGHRFPPRQFCFRRGLWLDEFDPRVRFDPRLGGFDPRFGMFGPLSNGFAPPDMHYSDRHHSCHRKTRNTDEDIGERLDNLSLAQPTVDA